MHNWPAMKPGTVGLNDGAMMAAADRITIQITGAATAPTYQTVDVVLVAAHTDYGGAEHRCRAMCVPLRVRSSACAQCRLVTWVPSVCCRDQATLVGTVRTSTMRCRPWSSAACTSCAARCA